MKDNPIVEELYELIKKCNDLVGNHILWVSKNGDVNISQVIEDNLEIDIQSNIKFRYEMFESGNDYVGFNAAEDNDWMKYLFDSLSENWSVNSQFPYKIKIDNIKYCCYY